MVKIAIIFNNDSLPGKLTKFFTGCYAYHIGFVEEETDTFYDMNLLFRKRYWSVYSAKKEVLLFSTPVEIPVSYLEEKLKIDTNVYGFLDYLLFAARPFYHLLGKSTRNAKGVICSEMVNEALREHGVQTPWPVTVAPPSPCDLFRYLSQRD